VDLSNIYMQNIKFHENFAIIEDWCFPNFGIFFTYDFYSIKKTPEDLSYDVIGWDKSSFVFSKSYYTDSENNTLYLYTNIKLD
jgi:hypothetical protein